MFTQINQFVKYLLEVPDTNSRFIFLIQGLAHVVAVIALTIAFVCAKDKANYPSMVLAVSGGGLAAGVSRFMTKKATSTSDQPQQ